MVALAVALSVAASAEAQGGRRLARPTDPSESPSAAATPAGRLESAGLGRALTRPGAHEDATGRTTAGAPGWALDLSAQTSFPLSVGVEAQLVTPLGLSAHLGVGHTPNAYLDAMTSILEESGAYSEALQPIVREAIADGAWNVRAGLGLSLPEGFELAAGYTYLTSSAALSPLAIEQAINQPLPWPAGTSVPVSLTMHALHARVGWRFLLVDHLVIRVALGWTHVVASSAHVDVPPGLDPPGGPADRIESAIGEGLGRYGFTPELIMSVGYRF